MIYGKDSLLLCTGLSLKEIGEIIKEKNIEKALEKKGNKFLDRYLTYKKYKELTESEQLKESIVPLFAAMPSLGKTAASREIATALGIGNVIGGDSFRAALREFIDKEKNPVFFTSIYETWKFFGEKTNENIIKGFKAQAKIVNHAMERIVADRGIRDGESMVVEYLHFFPSHYSKDVLEHPSFIPIILKTDSKEFWGKLIKMRVKKSHLKGGAQRLLDALDVYALLQKNLEEDAKKHGIPIVEVKGVWGDAVDKCLDIVFERIKKLNKIKGTIEESESVKKLKEERRLAKGKEEEMNR